MLKQFVRSVRLLQRTDAPLFVILGRHLRSRSIEIARRHIPLEHLAVAPVALDQYSLLLSSGVDAVAVPRHTRSQREGA